MIRLIFNESELCGSPPHDKGFAQKPHRPGLIPLHTEEVCIARMNATHGHRPPFLETGSALALDINNPFSLPAPCFPLEKLGIPEAGPSHPALADDGAKKQQQCHQQDFEIKS